MIKKLFILVTLLLINIPVFAQGVDTAWVRRYNGPGNSHDEPRAIAVDGSENVYVTGRSYGNATGYNFATVKYYPNGDTAWVRRYVEPGSSEDEARAVEVDDSGYIYVTGYVGPDYGQHYTTIKYKPDGDTVWVRTINGPGIATDLVIDGSGNVCVTGFAGYPSEDYTTIKYYPNGDTAWVRIYDGPINDRDWAYAMAVDDSGNIYVTGTSYGNGTSLDYATIKYYPNGDAAWVRRYNGPGNDQDLPSAITVDSYGNVYVTGRSQGSGTGFNYATIKYYPNGDTAWVRRYTEPTSLDDGARAVEVDDSGNVYVTGYVGQPYAQHYTTIKYYPNGDTAWLRTYSGPSVATDLVLDDSGSVYVTGISGYPSENYTTIKYCPNGDIAWVGIYDGPAHDRDWAYVMAIDGSGNIYVTGTSYGVGTLLDYATIKYVQTPNYVKDETGNREKPSEFTLSQNYPNPFNRSTKIEFTLPNSGFVSLNIYDLLGRKVKNLVSENLTSGYKSVFWDGKDNFGKEVASGIYFYQLKIGDFSQAKKLVLLK